MAESYDEWRWNAELKKTQASNHNLQIKVAELQAQLEQCEVKHVRSHEEAAYWRRMYTEQVTKIAALEAERDRLAGHLGDLQNVQKQLVGHYERLEAELQPWREMARQLEAMREKGYVIQTAMETAWEFILRDRACYSYVCEGRGYDSQPAAVAAAYSKVVGDE